MLANGAEELTDEAFRCPVREADLAAPSADAKEFGGGTFLVGRRLNCWTVRSNVVLIG